MALETTYISRLVGFQRVGVKMRVLLVFLMGCSLAEGRLVSKSELRGELMKEMKRQKELVDENILAKSKY